MAKTHPAKLGTRPCSVILRPGPFPKEGRLVRLRRNEHGSAWMLVRYVGRAANGDLVFEL